MKSYFKTALIVLFISGVAACKKENSTPVQSQLLQNIAVSDTTQGWNFLIGSNGIGNTNKYAHSFSKAHYVSAPYALKVSGNVVNEPTHFCYWTQYFNPINITTGAKLTLKAQVKLDQVTGPGVSLAVRGDKIDANGQYQVKFFRSTEKVTTITGTSDFKEYSLVLNSYPGDVDVIYVFLVYLPNTKGAAYFDDITLTAN